MTTSNAEQKPVKKRPSLAFEQSVGWPDLRVAGVDEVGRGPLAGDVIAAAVILPSQPRPWFERLADSKQISAKKREALHEIICEECVVGVGRGTLDDIAELNILWAAMLAMERAVMALEQKPNHVLIDGNRKPTKLNLPATTIVRGDTKSCAIAAASIVAKVERDREMVALDRIFPRYGWAQNKGYPSPYHRAALAKHGPCKYHRMSFKLSPTKDDMK